MTMIDWTKPIEFEDSAGERFSAVLTERDYECGYWPMKVKSDVGHYWAALDGEVPCTEYTVRNVAATERPMPEPTATWWARRWYDSASPDEREAMRVILAGEG